PTRRAVPEGRSTTSSSSLVPSPATRTRRVGPAAAVSAGLSVTRTSTGPPSRGRGSSARVASTARTSASRSGSTTSTATVRGWLGAPVVFTATASPTGATAGPVHGLRGAGPVERDAPVEDAGRPRGHDLPNREKPRQGAPRFLFKSQFSGEELSTCGEVALF